MSVNAEGSDYAYTYFSLDLFPILHLSDVDYADNIRYWPTEVMCFMKEPSDNFGTRWLSIGWVTRFNTSKDQQ